MGSPVSVQLLAFGQSILLGLSAGVLYDVLRPFRLRCPRITTLLDGAYCLTVGAVSFLFLLRRADGELRGFLVLGALGGGHLALQAVELPADGAQQHQEHDLGQQTGAGALLLFRLLCHICHLLCKHSTQFFLLYSIFLQNKRDFFRIAPFFCQNF